MSNGIHSFVGIPEGDTYKEVQKFDSLYVVGGVSGLWRFCEHNQKEVLVGCPTQRLAIASASNPLNRPITQRVKRTSHPMDNIEQFTMIGFFPLKGLRLQQVSIELGALYHE
jgi:hypothetical protein